MIDPTARLLSRTVSPTGFDLVPESRQPDPREEGLDSLIDRISEIVQRERLNPENYQSICCCLWPKKYPEGFQTKVREAITNSRGITNHAFEQRIETLRQKIQAQKAFIARLNETNNHELKTAVNGISGGARVIKEKNLPLDAEETQEYLAAIQNLSLRQLQFFEQNLNSQRKIEEHIEIAPDFDQLSETIENIGSLKSLYGDLYFLLYPKKSPSAVLPDFPEHREVLRSVLQANIYSLNPTLARDIQELVEQFEIQKSLIRDLMEQNTYPMRATLKALALTADILQKNKDVLNAKDMTILFDLSEQLLHLFHEGSDLHQSFELSSTKFSISRLLNQIKLNYLRQIDISKINLEFKAQEGIPPKLIGDISLIRKIIENILFSHINCMEKGNINIDVRSENINENGEDKVLLYFEISTKTNADEISLPEDIQQSIERLLRTATRLITLMGGEILLEESLSIETETRTTFSFNIKLESHVDSSRELLTVGDDNKKITWKKNIDCR